MVLIPEERLLRYEERDKQKPENGMMYGGGEEEEEEPAGRFLIGGNDRTWYSQNHENKSRSITGPFKRKRRRYYMGRYGSSPSGRCSYTKIQHFRSGVGCDEIS